MPQVIKDRFYYLLTRAFVFPISFLSYRGINHLGNFIGWVVYHVFSSYRKRALSNIANSNLNVSSPDIERIARGSIQNLIICFLEYAKLDREKDIHAVATCENPEEAQALICEGKGVIFFCAHQANWEILFLEGTSRMSGVAIGRPTKNALLYQWVTRIREKFGGKMVVPQNAVKEGLRALRKGQFFGIVGDQALPESSYSSLFLGRKAYTSSIPALLSYKTGCPVIFAETVRVDAKYRIHYFPPIWPQKENTLEEETTRIMDITLSLLESSIRKCPSQWLWTHNRWKQQSLKTIKGLFRYDTLLIILPEETDAFEKYHSLLPCFREIYPTETIFIMVPEKHQTRINNAVFEIIPYKGLSEVLQRDFRYKCIFNFSSFSEVKSHYLKLATFQVFTFEDLKQLSGIDTDNLSEILKRSICRAS